MKSALVEGKKKRGRKGIPKELIYEMRYGKPIYYRDYDKVLSGEKSLEEVVGSSKLQAILVVLIATFLMQELRNRFKRNYIVTSNELGFSFAPRSWRNLDIAVFKKEELIKEGIDDKYVKTPPEVVIEIDTKADLRKFPIPHNYFYQKIDDLLNAGVGKVIWIFTSDRKILIADKGKDWVIQPWSKNFKVLEGININVEKLLREEGVYIEK
ncbi:Uma2 family endonuclease [Desulfurobacterium thermolithotrophum]|uniref:Uma2 family endonuclease n=1 Tax=Desulfurobacterium thermolithotrophum TaxID=64160 RepID=UPI0013D585C1|nr:Uma2 family endonuclease [Desulfurobacterium thermolithotrophum]